MRGVAVGEGFMIIYIYKEIVLKKSGRVRLKRVAAGEGKDEGDGIYLRETTIPRDGIDHDVAHMT